MTMSDTSTLPAPSEPDDRDTDVVKRALVASHRRGRRRRRPLVIGVLAAMAALLGAAGVAVALTAKALPGKVGRIDNAFQGVDDSQRPTKAATAKGSLTFLLVGTDSRDRDGTTGSDAGDPTFRTRAQRSDVQMMAHISADRSSAAVISVPRDSWVTIPNRGKMKLNAAYSLGGAPLMIKTMEQLTGDRIDHFAVVDFYGFKAVVDAVGGVDITMARANTSGRYHFKSGVNHLNGNQALAYVRERHNLPRGDLDRVQRQQALIRGIMNRASTLNPVSDPVKTYQLVDAGTRSVTVDDRLSDADLRSLALSLIGIRGNVSFLTAPVRGTGREGDQSVVYLDDTRCADLWAAIRDDKVTDYLTSHSNQVLTDTPR
jgi:LCP family protein required for cell wall assembly